MDKHEYCVAELAAYLEGLIAAGKGDATVLLMGEDEGDPSGLLLRMGYTRGDDSIDEPGVVTLYYGDL